jgi:ribosomal protein S18 acetylase RimI-like enzyme
MHSNDTNGLSVRSLLPEDRTSVSKLISATENFNPSEKECALELVDIYLEDKNQGDYRVAVAESPESGICGYACWGPTPMTKGTYDLYWIATHPRYRSRGVGRELMSYVESKIREEKGRLLVVETSSKESYRNTVEFYRLQNYEEASCIADFYEDGDDKLVFVKRFPQ